MAELELSDEQLMMMFRYGNRAAFDTLFERHRRSVYNFARRMTGDRAAAEDICQEAFLRLVAAAGSYENSGRFRAWLFRIARNCCLHALRHRPPTAGDLDRFAARQDDSAEALSRAETERRPEAAILALPENWRESFLLRYRHGLEYEEIAAVTEQPLGTVKTCIHRARLSLTEKMRGTG